MTTISTAYAFSFAGQIFGGANSPYQILSVDGLESLPALRVQDDNRGYNDGMFSGRDFLAGRTISIIFNTFGSGSNSAQENFNTIQSKLLPQTSGTTPLYFYLPPNTTQFVNARVRALRTSVTPEYTYGYITSQVEFFCPDPRYYNAAEQTATFVYSANAGRTYDRTYDLDYGGGTSYKTTTVTNLGWTTTYPLITVNGPIINPELGNLTTGDQLNFNCTLISTDVLEVDLYNKLITLNNQPARNLLTSGTWFGAIPGNNTFTIDGTGTAVGATSVTITWNSAYI
jgi:phage-related protein